MDVVRDAVVEATSVCDANLGIAPAVVYVSSSSSLGDDAGVEVVGVNGGGGSGGGEGCSVTLVRPYVHHALVELLKNAMASSVQRSIRSSRCGVDEEGDYGDSGILPSSSSQLHFYYHHQYYQTYRKNTSQHHRLHRHNRIQIYTHILPPTMGSNRRTAILRHSPCSPR